MAVVSNTKVRLCTNKAKLKAYIIFFYSCFIEK